jgi:hypothetical protein
MWIALEKPILEKMPAFSLYVLVWHVRSELREHPNTHAIFHQLEQQYVLLFHQLEQQYVLLYTSPQRGFMRLYRRKAEGTEQ